MESIKFKIDSDKVKSLKKKALKKVLKIGLPAALIPITLMLYSGQIKFDQPILYVVYFVGITIVIGFSFWMGIQLGIKNQLNTQLELNKDGIQRIMQNSSFISIPWNKLETDYNKTGELILIDSSTNKILRWYNGTGKILVPDELENYNKFIKIIKRMKSVQATT